jgi:hypothetical protein
VASLTPTPPSEPLKPSTEAAVRDHRSAVRNQSESLSAINRNTCPQSPESARDNPVDCTQDRLHGPDAERVIKKAEVDGRQAGGRADGCRGEAEGPEELLSCRRSTWVCRSPVVPPAPIFGWVPRALGSSSRIDDAAPSLAVGNANKSPLKPLDCPTGGEATSSHEPPLPRQPSSCGSNPRAVASSPDGR